MIKVVQETITPDRAREYLATVDQQRRVTKSHVARLARSMSAGHWRMTGEPIQFDKQGHLINGQHRLHAIIQSGVTLPVLVLRGLDHSVYEVMDQGRPRSRSETAATLGIKNASGVSASTQILIRLKYGTEVDRVQVDNAEIMEFIKVNRDMVEEAGVQARRYGVLPASTYGAFLFLAMHASRDRAMEFAELMATGAGLELGHPALTMRNKASAIKHSKNRLEESRTSKLLPLLVRAFDAFVDGQSLHKIIYEPDNYYPRLINRERFWEDK
jgi:hypothetical protein